MTTTNARRLDVPVDRIDPDPGQARRFFDPAQAGELAESMAAAGLAVPILLRPAGDRYVIVHGERRWRAARALDWPTIPAEVRDLTAEQARWLALAENIQRADLTPLEEGEAFRAVLAGGGVTQAELGRRIGKSQGYIAQKLRLLTLPPPLAFYLARGALTEGHARQLLRLRAFYGEDLDSDLDWRSGGEKRPGLFAEPCYVMGFFIATRPEDRPVSWFHDVAGEEGRQRPEVSLLAEACAAFVAHAISTQADTGRLPQWELAAFWWASHAVNSGLSVAELHDRLDAWEERLHSAVAYCHGWGLDFAAQDAGNAVRERVRELFHWGYRSDLRHAGVSSWGEADGPHFTRALEHLHRTGYVVAPSRVNHPLGHEVEELQALGLCHVT